MLQILRKIRTYFIKPLRMFATIVLLASFASLWGGVFGTVAISSDIEKSENNKFEAGEWDDDLAVPLTQLDHIVITEVLYDDSSDDDTGKEWIELYNGTDGEVDMSGMDLFATTGDDFIFPGGFKLSQFSFVVVHWNLVGSDSATDLYTGTSDSFDNMGNTSGWVALFKNSTHSKDTIIDYLEYGAGGQTAESKAADAGIWTAGDFIPDVNEGYSIEKKEKDIDLNKASEFKDQSIPTPKK
ncbi:MAG: hypothetical protein A3J76_00710 [Candidatus Moranbacteria bacterium RBG_13_45_13]|nr:MAG: hypothetical protein A3J76_00710 [Candidatus Moranbacteria bacterium RBG_13_45_13]